MSRASKILIADDDELLVRLLEHKLGLAGFDVSSVGDGEAAVEAARDTLPDILLLDNMMPGLDGYEVLRQLKADPKTEKIPVIMLSARKMENDVVTGLSLGAAEYLVKPFMPDELLARIKRLVDTP